MVESAIILRQDDLVMVNSFSSSDSGAAVEGEERKANSWGAQETVAQPTITTVSFSSLP